MRRTVTFSDDVDDEGVIAIHAAADIGQVPTGDEKTKAFLERVRKDLEMNDDTSAAISLAEPWPKEKKHVVVSIAEESSEAAESLKNSNPKHGASVYGSAAERVLVPAVDDNEENKKKEENGISAQMVAKIDPPKIKSGKKGVTKKSSNVLDQIIRNAPLKKVHPVTKPPKKQGQPKNVTEKTPDKTEAKKTPDKTEAEKTPDKTDLKIAEDIPTPEPEASPITTLLTKESIPKALLTREESLKQAEGFIVLNPGTAKLCQGSSELLRIFQRPFQRPSTILLDAASVNGSNLSRSQSTRSFVRHRSTRRSANVQKVKSFMMMAASLGEAAPPQTLDPRWKGPPYPRFGTDAWGIPRENCRTIDVGPVIGLATDTTVRVLGESKIGGEFRLTAIAMDDNRIKHQQSCRLTLRPGIPGVFELDNLLPDTEYDIAWNCPIQHSFGASFRTMPSGGITVLAHKAPAVALLGKRQSKVITPYRHANLKPSSSLSGWGGGPQLNRWVPSNDATLRAIYAAANCGQSSWSLHVGGHCVNSPAPMVLGEEIEIADEQEKVVQVLRAAAQMVLSVGAKEMADVRNSVTDLFRDIFRDEYKVEYQRHLFSRCSNLFVTSRPDFPLPSAMYAAEILSDFALPTQKLDFLLCAAAEAFCEYRLALVEDYELFTVFDLATRKKTQGISYLPPMHTFHCVGDVAFACLDDVSQSLWEAYDRFVFGKAPRETNKCVRLLGAAQWQDLISALNSETGFLKQARQLVIATSSPLFPGDSRLDSAWTVPRNASERGDLARILLRWITEAPVGQRSVTLVSSGNSDGEVFDLRDEQSVGLQTKYAYLRCVTLPPLSSHAVPYGELPTESQVIPLPTTARVKFEVNRNTCCNRAALIRRMSTGFGSDSGEPWAVTSWLQLAGQLSSRATATRAETCLSAADALDRLMSKVEPGNTPNATAWIRRWQKFVNPDEGESLTQLVDSPMPTQFGEALPRWGIASKELPFLRREVLLVIPMREKETGAASLKFSATLLPGREFERNDETSWWLPIAGAPLYGKRENVMKGQRHHCVAQVTMQKEKFGQFFRKTGKGQGVEKLQYRVKQDEFRGY